MNALVVGSSGFLGRSVITALRQAGIGAHGTYRQEVVPDASPFDFWGDDVAPLLTKTGADTVVFCAAVETDTPTAQLAERAERFFRACAGLRVVYGSSDAVFDGLAGNYTETDPPSPTTLYGRNLVAVERIVRERCPDACVIRPSYLYGFSGGALDTRLESVRRRLLAGETVTYAENMFKSPMEVFMAADAVMRLARSSFIGTVHIGGARSSVYGFYRDAMTVLGVPTTTLRADRSPGGAGVPKDTSLHCALMTRLTGVPVLSVRETLGDRTQS